MRPNVVVLAWVSVVVAGCAHDSPRHPDNETTVCFPAAVCKDGSCGGRPVTPTAPVRPLVGARAPGSANPTAPTPMPYAIERLQSVPPTPAPITPAPVMSESVEFPPVALPQQRQRTLPDAAPVAPKTSEPPSSTPSVQKTAHETVPANTHSPDSIELMGAVSTWRKTRRLCYASPETEDRYGGRVTLLGDPRIEQLKDGQVVRVRGLLIPPTDRNSPPQFHVESMEVFE